MESVLLLWSLPLSTGPVTLWEVLLAFFSRDLPTLTRAFAHPDRNRFILQIVALAGLSEAIGQSVVLFANRVKPVRFILSLIISAGISMVGYLVWVMSLWLVAQFVFDRSLGLSLVATTVGLSYLPLMLSFLALIPYAGHRLFQLLNVWASVVLVDLLRLTFSFALWQAVACAVIGLVFILLLRSTVGRPLRWLARKLRNIAAGTKLQLDLRQLFEADGSDGAGSGRAP
jgi:hypothetical protein